MTQTRFQKLCQHVAFPLVAIMLAGAVQPGRSYAVMIPTDQIIQAAELQADRARVREFMARADVRQQMAMLGVNAAEAEARVATLSEAEVLQIVDRLDQLPAGQSTAGAIIGAILLVFLILLITDIIGWTDVYPFVHSP